MQKIKEYFKDGIMSQTLQTVGAEVETQFVDNEGNPISTQASQQILARLVECGWLIGSRKGNLVTTLVDSSGNRIFYELGRHNIEVATIVSTSEQVLGVVQECLDQLYEAARKVGAVPYFAPILPGEEDLLVIPDERDAIWLELDGRAALALLARISAVQFTISVAPQDTVRILNAFGKQINSFLVDFPQDAVWKKYITDSSAGYLSSRYGGPLIFKSLDDYCQALVRHDVVQGAHLVPFVSVNDLDISLYLRSIWWHFRLKRYGNALCVEVRPMARRTDEYLQDQLEKVLNTVCA